MSRKVFISFLGATNYGPCDYQINGESFGTERFIQVSTLRMLTKNRDWSPSDKAYILLTNDAEKKNWMDEGQCNPKTKEPIKDLKGLNSDLNTLANEIGADFFPGIEPVRNLPDGNNETEIWEIFSKVFEKIQDGDELYFDITHGYRYLPMLILVLNNYAKFLKKASVKSLTYGNYEISERGQKPGSIVDLLPLSTLQDWTFAAGQYISSGYVEELQRLCNDKIEPLLRNSKGKDADAFKLKGFSKSLVEVVNDFHTCRGNKIRTGERLKLLEERTVALGESIIPPLNPIIAKISNSVSSFITTPGDDPIKESNNGIAAADWCFSHGLYQQSITILQETIISYLCDRHKLNIIDEKERKLVTSSFAVMVKGKEIPRDKWKGNESDKGKMDSIIADPIFNKLLSHFNLLSQARNDINHFGMRQVPSDADSIIKNNKDCLREIEKIIKYHVDQLI